MAYMIRSKKMCINLWIKILQSEENRRLFGAIPTTMPNREWTLLVFDSFTGLNSKLTNHIVSDQHGIWFPTPSDLGYYLFYVLILFFFF